MNAIKNFFKNQSPIYKYTRKILYGFVEWIIVLITLWFTVLITDLIFDVNIVFNDVLKLSVVTYFLSWGFFSTLLFIMTQLKKRLDADFDPDLGKEIEKYIQKD